jgi:hypothetical protein
MLSTASTESKPLTLQLLLDTVEQIENYRPEPVCPPHVAYASAIQYAKRGITDGVTCLACGAFIPR